MSDTTTWLTKYVSGDELAKATEDFDAAFKIAANNFENDEWYVDDCVNFIYDHISESLEHIGEDTIKNAIELVFVENVVDESKEDSLEDDEQDKKLTQSQRDFMGGAYYNEDDEDADEYDDEDYIDDEF
jgi:6-phosphogluconate dehydrogenase